MKVFLHFSVAETVREVENLLDWQQHRQEQKKKQTAGGRGFSLKYSILL